MGGRRALRRIGCAAPFLPQKSEEILVRTNESRSKETAPKELGQESTELKCTNPLGFQVLMLDVDRNPIVGQRYRLHFAGRSIEGETGKNGLTRKIKTTSSADEVQIAIGRLDSSLKIVARVLSGYGDKLVTIISPKIRIESKSFEHPPVTREVDQSKDKKITPQYDPRMSQPPTLGKKQFGLKTALTKTTNGAALVKVEGDIPTLDFLSDYVDDPVTEQDFSWAAQELNVEVAAIKAFARVESRGVGFFDFAQKKLPKILYERHKFAAFTNNAYSIVYPDISLPVAYYNQTTRYIAANEDYKKKRGISSDIQYYRALRKKDDNVEGEQVMTLKELIATGKATVEGDKYLEGAGSYRRLVKAYQLDPSAALKSCSWGAFQIMGEFWDAMGFSSVEEFTKFISRSEKNQVKAFVLYIKLVNPTIVGHLRRLDWIGAARAYNGPGYTANAYHTKLAVEYEKIRSEE